MSGRAKSILADLETMRENLLAVADEVWQGINYRDRSSREQRLRALDAYNEKVEEFDRLADELASMIADLSDISPEPAPAVMSVDAARNERIIQQLDTATPHGLDEDFSYKRPFGFVLRGRAFTEITTWKQLYQIFCQQLAAMDPATFDGLPSSATFISPQDKHAFSRNRKALRSPLLIAREIYAETHYSANSIRDNMKRLLGTFKINPADLRLYLRQDRDAGRDGVA